MCVKVEATLRGGGVAAGEEQHAEGVGRDGGAAAAAAALVHTGRRDSGLLPLHSLEDVPEVRRRHRQCLRHSGGI